ncbi:MAG: hypothetical protein ACK5NK_15865 [Niabella sp.]
MKNLFWILIAFFSVVLLLSSCAPKITGTWNIDKYETTIPGQEGIRLTNIGTMKFKKNGDGEKNITYTLFGRNKQDFSSFGWYSTGPYIGIESPGSDFSKTWIIITNKRKQQKWKSTDGANGVQVLELSK